MIQNTIHWNTLEEENLIGDKYNQSIGIPRAAEENLKLISRLEGS